MKRFKIIITAVLIALISFMTVTTIQTYNELKAVKTEFQAFRNDTMRVMIGLYVNQTSFEEYQLNFNNKTLTWAEIVNQKVFPDRLKP